MLKQELKRAFCSKEWKMAIFIGVFISLVQYYSHTIQAIKLLDLGPMKGMIPHSVFSKWMGADGYTYASRFYFLVLPILAVLPYGASYFEDLKKGYIRQMVLLKGRRKYILSKYIAAFIAGGTVVVFPLILNLIMTLFVLPSIKPVIAVGYFPWNQAKRFLPMLPYVNPYLYTGIYLIIIFIFSGTLNGISLAISIAAKNKFIVWMAPFIIVAFIGSIASFLGYGFYNIAEFLNPAQMISGISWNTLIISFLVITIPSVSMYLIGGWNIEIY